jgi:carbon storage regulator CsrA
MLILTRNLGEFIVIETPSGDKITIKVLPLDKFYADARLGVNAPSSYKIHRFPK